MCYHCDGADETDVIRGSGSTVTNVVHPFPIRFASSETNLLREYSEVLVTVSLMCVCAKFSRRVQI